jgi:glutamate carboxypeptidase
MRGERKMPLLSIGEFETRLPDLIGLLQQLVEQESPTTAKDQIDELGRRLAGEMKGRGAQLTHFEENQAGDHWMGLWGEGEEQILLLTHMDTVHPLGSLESMPWNVSENRLYGPGVLDMKVSIAMALTALDALTAQGRLEKRVALLCTSDEETGSHTSKNLIEELAAESMLVLCLEPALPDGSLKTWRKGILNFRLEAHGTAAHAGSDIGSGVNAILEMAHQVQVVSKLGDDDHGTTINVGVINGGTRSNVVPQHCRARIDVRAMNHSEGERIRRAMESLEPVLDGARLELRGGWNRPPMERDALMIETFQRAQEIGGQIGLTLTEGGTGGGSDANFVARLGVPVLDGLGAIGRGAHTSEEQVELESLAERTALLAALISGW